MDLKCIFHTSEPPLDSYTLHYMRQNSISWSQIDHNFTLDSADSCVRDMDNNRVTPNFASIRHWTQECNLPFCGNMRDNE